MENKSDTSRKRLIFRLTAFGLVAISLFVAVLFFSSRLDKNPTYTGGKIVGKPVPDVTLTTLDGEKVKLKNLEGKRVMINFFNSWCIPCQQEEPALQEFANQHNGDPDFVFIGIVRSDTERNIRNWVKGTDAPFDVMFDDDDKASIAFATSGQPETYAIDRNGTVVASLLSIASVDSLNEMWEATQ